MPIVIVILFVPMFEHCYYEKPDESKYVFDENGCAILKSNLDGKDENGLPAYNWNECGVLLINNVPTCEIRSIIGFI